MTQHFARGTYLEPEERAYPNGGQTRKGAAVFPDGKVRRIWAGTPDTYYTIPAHGRIRGRWISGYVSVDVLTDTGPDRAWVDGSEHSAEGTLTFHPMARR